jgi:hypothetical protein
MAIRIFRTQRNATESWLAVNDDGTVTYHVENLGTRRRRDGLDERVRTMSASEAKARWPSYSQSIDLAVAEVIKRRNTPLDPIASTLTNDGAKFRSSEIKHLLDRFVTENHKRWRARLIVRLRASGPRS